MQRTKRFCHLSILTPPFFGIAPLKIRGDRGVMKIMEITPFIPPYFKGDIGEGISECL
jgi:hypothetical protein